MPSLPDEILFLNKLSSKELANELESFPDCATFERENNTLMIYY